MNIINRASRALASAVVAGAGVLAFATPAFAGVGIGVAPNFPTSVTVGQNGVAVSMDITNTSNGGVTNIDLTSIKLTPQCGGFSNPCTTKDPGVFSVSASGTGAGACAANTFTIAETDATTGEVTFTPNATITLAPTATCTVNFTVNVLKVPTLDATGLTGIDTVQRGNVAAIETNGVLPGDGSGTDVTTVTKATPSIATQQSAGGAIGTVLNDTATLSGGVNPTGNVTFKLFAPSDPTCSSAAVYTDVDPSAPYATSPGFVSNAAGVWHWTADYAGDANNTATSSPCTAEPVTVTKVDSRTVTEIHNASHAIIATTTVGTMVHDKAIVSAAVGSTTPTGNVSFQLYSDAACGQANGAPQVVALAGGTAETSAIAATTPGLSYKATYSGDSNFNGSVGDCEPLLVSKIDPNVATDIHDSAHFIVLSANAGATVHDKATVTGSGPTPTGTVDFTWYTNGTCSSEGSPAGTAIALDGSGVAHPSSSEGPLGTGSYSFKAHYNGDANYNAKDGPCEPLTINQLTPTVTTDIHDANHGVVTSVAAGATVHDKATVAGGAGNPVPTGTVDFAWYTNNTCTGSSTPAGVGIAVDGSGIAHPSSSEGPLAVGSYAFKAHYNGDANYAAADGACEPLAVNKLDSNTVTEIHNTAHGVITTANQGDMVHDKAIVSGSGPTPTGNVSFQLYSDNACGQATSSPQVVALASGSAETTAVSAVAPGMSYKATYAGDATYNGSVGACEPLTVNAQNQYCSPGYWKQEQHFDSYVTYAPTDLFNTVFGVSSFPGKTLVQVLSTGGGGLEAYGRKAVGALLNASALQSGLTPAQVIAKVQATIAGAPSNPKLLNGYYGSANPEFTAPENCPLN